MSDSNSDPLTFDGLTFDDLAVIVVNFGSHDLLELNLAQMGTNLPGARIIVVDNWHSIAERKAITKLCAQHGWLLIALDSNTGFGNGCNHGAAAALAGDATVLLFINPDAHIAADSVQLLATEVRGDAMVLAAPRIFTKAGALWSAGMDIDMTTGNSRGWHRRDEFPYAARIEWFTGACLMLSSSLWQASGGFDDDYFLYWEDVDFSARVRAAGGHLKLVEEANATHDVGGTQTSTSSRSKSEVYYYYNIRNRSLFAGKQLTSADRRVWKKSARRAAWAIILRGGRRQLLQSFAPWRALWRGLRDSDYGV